jgi:REP element-mobilizing transposase RayT
MIQERLHRLDPIYSNQPL